MAAFLSKYGVARHIYIPVVKRAVVDFAVGADWTPAAGDVKISKDGGAAANVTNLPSAIAMGNGAIWDFSLTATEMQAAQIVVTVADSATKAVEDQSFIIETYGNASGQHAVDLSDSVRAGLTGLANAVPGAAGGLFIAGTNAATTITSAGGDALTLSSTGANGVGLKVSGNGTGDGIKSTAGATGHALELIGGGTSGDGLKATVTSGVPIRGDITGNITGNLSGSAGSVTGAVGSVTGAVGSVTGAVGSVTGLTAATVHSDLDDIQARLPAALTGAGNMKSDALAIDGSTSAATHLSAHTLTAVPVTCAAGGSTTTVVLVNVDGAAASATDDFYNGRVLIFTAPGGLKYQATDITDYVGATKTATITAVTAATDASTTAIMV